VGSSDTSGRPADVDAIVRMRNNPVHIVASS
jgi:hypothetical protein